MFSIDGETWLWLCRNFDSLIISYKVKTHLESIWELYVIDKSIVTGLIFITWRYWCHHQMSEFYIYEWLLSNNFSNTPIQMIKDMEYVLIARAIDIPNSLERGYP